MITSPVRLRRAAALALALSSCIQLPLAIVELGVQPALGAGLLVVAGVSALVAARLWHSQDVTALRIGAIIAVGVGGIVVLSQLFSLPGLGTDEVDRLMGLAIIVLAVVFSASALVMEVQPRSVDRPLWLDVPARRRGGTVGQPGGGFRLPRLRRAVKEIPGLVRLVKGARHARAEVNAMFHGVSAGRLGSLLAGGAARARFAAQAPMPSAAVALQSRPNEDLRARLEAADLERFGAGQAVYLPPQSGLERVLGDLVHLYPRDAGFRVSEGSGRAAEAPLVAGALHLRGLAPRLYDALPPGADPGMSLLAVQDERLREARRGEERAVIRAVSRLVSSGELAVVSEDWGARHNVQVTDRAAYYTGFEHLKVVSQRALVKSVLDEEARSDLHFGTEYAVKGRRYLYQSVPSIGATGRRNSLRRWEVISSMLEDSGVTPSGRVVLDVGCNAGMMLAAALASGAHWGLGWDMPEVARHGRRLMHALGYTRFDLFGADLSERYDLGGDIPDFLVPRLDGAVVFYLAIRHHVGFVSQLGDLPWTALVYEGGEEESVETLEDHLADLRAMCDFSIAAAIDFRDGETGARPLALLTRS